jgi:hypothetical protein
MKKIKDYILTRIKEPSTVSAVAGVIVYFTNKYFQFANEASLITIISIIFGCILTVTEEK